MKTRLRFALPMQLNEAGLMPGRFVHHTYSSRATCRPACDIRFASLDVYWSCGGYDKIRYECRFAALALYRNSPIMKAYENLGPLIAKDFGLICLREGRQARTPCARSSLFNSIVLSAHGRQGAFRALKGVNLLPVSSGACREILPLALLSKVPVKTAARSCKDWYARCVACVWGGVVCCSLAGNLCKLQGAWMVLILSFSRIP